MQSITDKLFYGVIIAVAITVLFRFYQEERDCSLEGGKYLRTLYGYECIKTKEK